MIARGLPPKPGVSPSPDAARCVCTEFALTLFSLRTETTFARNIELRESSIVSSDDVFCFASFFRVSFFYLQRADRTERKAPSPHGSPVDKIRVYYCHPALTLQRTRSGSTKWIFTRGVPFPRPNFIWLDSPSWRNAISSGDSSE